MNTADLLVKCLEEEGVKYIFGIPGEETLDLMNSIADSKQIKFITTRHEQGAAFMADVYGRLTEKRRLSGNFGPGSNQFGHRRCRRQPRGAPLVAITGRSELTKCISRPINI